MDTDNIEAQLPEPVTVIATDHALLPGMVNLFATRNDREEQEEQARQAEELVRDLASQHEPITAARSTVPSGHYPVNLSAPCSVGMTVSDIGSGQAVG